MQTYNHFIFALGFSEYIEKKVVSKDSVKELHTEESTLKSKFILFFRRLLGFNIRSTPFEKRWFLLGSIFPDLPMIFFTAGVVVLAFFGIELFEGVHGISSFIEFLDSVYWTHPIVLLVYNSFHSPLLLSVYWVIANIIQPLSPKLYNKLSWFLLGCAFHVAFDIPLHHDDGPLLLYPISTTITFISPISYWDPDHFGNIFFPLEHFLSLLIIAWLIYKRFSKKKLNLANKHTP